MQTPRPIVIRGKIHSVCGVDQWRQYTRRTRKGTPYQAWECVICKRRLSVESRRQRIQRAIEAYGGKCAACGETDRDVLTFDHVDDNGARHREELGSRAPDVLVRWARINGWPDALQVLCANCQLRKQRRLWRAA